MKKNKIFFALIAVILFVSLFLAPHNVMSVPVPDDDVVCCIRRWTSAMFAGADHETIYWCCYSGNTCTPCIIVT